MNTGPEVEQSVLDSIMVSLDSDTYVDSGIQYTFNVPISTSLNKLSVDPKPIEKPVRYTPGTLEWLAQCIWTVQMPRAVGELSIWMPNGQQREASEQTVLAIRNLKF